MKKVRVGLGQDSHRFLSSDSSKPCIIAGVIFEDVPGFSANSDGDVVYHAICNAISSISHVRILGGMADDLLINDGITDSSVYLEEALKTLKGFEITHVAISLEGKRPKFLKFVEKMRANIAQVLQIDIDLVGLTATTGEGLTDFGCGDGIQCLVLLTVMEN